jgi:peptide/nickel transport system permease protein
VYQPKRSLTAAPVEMAAPGTLWASSAPSHATHGRLARRIFRHKLLTAGLILFGSILVIAVTAPLLAPHAAEQKFVPLEAPSRRYLFGTDDFGRDLLSRVLYGAGISLQIAVSVVAVSGLAGTALGSASGYVRKLDNPIMRVMDALMAFPAVLLALGIGAMLGPSEVNVIIALAVVYTPGTARIVRASVLVVRERLYVEAAVAFGASHWRVLLKHILPNSMAPLIVQLTFVFAYAVLAEAILSFLGVGPPPPAPTWGNIISEGRDYITIAPWIAFFPGVFIAVTVLGLNLLGDGFRDVIDPRMVPE